MTIAEIAKMAGVSRTSVSRYLNNGYISEEKRDKIAEVIKKTGYQPSMQAQMLRTKKTKMIGVVLPKINSEAISRVVAGISAAVVQEGFQIIMANTENNVEKELEYLSLFQNNFVDGIIFIATIMTKKHKELLNTLKIPIVVVGQNAEKVSCIYHDDFHTAEQLTTLMIQKGKKMIGYIGVTERDKAAGLDRKNGYLEALRRQQIPIQEKLMTRGDFSMESGYENMKILLEENCNLDGVFCATDSIAIGAMKYLKEVKKKIPEEISIVGIGHTKMSEVVTPKLTTAHYYYKTSGIEAGNMLISMMQETDFARKELKLSARIISQETV